MCIRTLGRGWKNKNMQKLLQKKIFIAVGIVLVVVFIFVLYTPKFTLNKNLSTENDLDFVEQMNDTRPEQIYDKDYSLYPLQYHKWINYSQQLVEDQLAYEGEKLDVKSFSQNSIIDNLYTISCNDNTNGLSPFEYWDRHNMDKDTVTSIVTIKRSGATIHKELFENNKCNGYLKVFNVDTGKYYYILKTTSFGDDHNGNTEDWTLINLNKNFTYASLHEIYNTGISAGGYSDSDLATYNRFFELKNKIYIHIYKRYDTSYLASDNPSSVINIMTVFSFDPVSGILKDSSDEFSKYYKNASVSLGNAISNLGYFLKENNQEDLFGVFYVTQPLIAFYKLNEYASGKDIAKNELHTMCMKLGDSSECTSLEQKIITAIDQ